MVLHLLEFALCCLCKFGDILPLVYQISMKPAQFYGLGKSLNELFYITNEQQMMS